MNYKNYFEIIYSVLGMFYFLDFRYLILLKVR